MLDLAVIALRALLLLALVATLTGCPPSQPSHNPRHATADEPTSRPILAPQPAPARHLLAASP